MSAVTGRETRVLRRTYRKMVRLSARLEAHGYPLAARQAWDQAEAILRTLRTEERP